MCVSSLLSSLWISFSNIISNCARSTNDPEKCFAHSATAAKSLQSYPTLCDPIDVSPPGSPASGILQERTLEWVAISFSNA